MWSDFFSEDDPSEISKEYDQLLQSLLTTPVDDFDLALNVFNNVDQDGEGSGVGNGDGTDSDDHAKYCIDQIRSDHCYTLPWDETSALLTPPNSSDDSDDPETELSSSRTYPNPRKISVKPETTKFMHKTVKLKHKKDLKFVFSIKVKDSVPTAVQLSPGRSLLKKNHPAAGGPPAAPSTSAEDLVRDVLNKRAYRKRQRLNEAALAVQTLLGAEDRQSFQADRFLKMQTDREIHNSMERQRRIDLKNEFDNLKTLIPDIAGSDKVSKLNVLNYSAEYVKRLERTDLKLKLRKQQLKEKRLKLLEQLKQLNIMY